MNLILGKKIISPQGAAITLTEVELTDAGKEALSTNGAVIPPAKSQNWLEYLRSPEGVYDMHTLLALNGVLSLFLASTGVHNVFGSVGNILSAVIVSIVIIHRSTR